MSMHAKRRGRDAFPEKAMRETGTICIGILVQRKIMQNNVKQVERLRLPNLLSCNCIPEC